MKSVPNLNRNQAEAHVLDNLRTPDNATVGPPHIRDGLEAKRMTLIVLLALAPCILMAVYNTGYQANYAVAVQGAAPLNTWQTRMLNAWDIGFSPDSPWACFLHGALYFVPIYLVTVVVAGFCELLFAVLRKHEVGIGFLVTSTVFSLILPVTVPLWQAAVGIGFGLIVAKGILGRAGLNVVNFNPALTALAFLAVAFPGYITGGNVWIAANYSHADGVTSATWLARLSENGLGALGQGLSWMDAFVGLIPGAMGETSTLLCIVGVVILLVTKLGSWRTMVGVLLGSFAMVGFLNVLPPDNSYWRLPFYWHWVLGGFAFATVFIATDPATSPVTGLGRLLYGLCIGILGILMRAVNPMFPESWMIVVLFMNLLSPLFDYVIVRANIKRRMSRHAV